MKLTDLTHPAETQLTPKQKRLLSQPNIQMLIKKLDCKIDPSPEFKKNLAISRRVDELISTIQSTPATPRQITKPLSPFFQPPLKIQYDSNGEIICPF